MTVEVAPGSVVAHRGRRHGIFSQKFTQLFGGPRQVQESTALAYLRELRDKYGRNRTIANTPNNVGQSDLPVGAALGAQAELVLEIPVQDVVPALTDAICVAAAASLTNAGVRIIDVSGREYCV